MGLNPDGQIVCVACGYAYTDDAEFLAAHPGPYAAVALEAAKTPVPIVNCGKCPVSAARRSNTG